jgi:hypothetical protein
MTSANPELRRVGDQIFERYNIYPGVGERNHCLRLIEFALLHGREMKVSVDEDLLHLAAMLHDLGLMVSIEPDTNYLTRTVEIARKELAPVELGDERWQPLEDCLLYNHAVRPPYELPPVAECFRRAVFTEHTRGVRRFGVSRHLVKAVFREIPWANFSAVLADFVWKTALFEPGSLRQIFLPR